MPSRSPRPSDSQPLPVHPQPLPDEWLGSWLLRLAQANMLTLSQLLSHLNIDASRERPTAAETRRLRAATGTTLETLHTLRPPAGALLSDRPPSVFGVHQFQVCPDCLRRDRTPYIRREWLLLRAIACPEHGGPLREACPHCHGSLRLTPQPLASRPVPPPEVLRQEADLRRCPRCTGDISTDDGQGRTVIPAISRPHHIMTRRVRQEDWTAFRDALWHVILTFRLDTMLQPEQLFLQPHGVMPTAHTPQSRMDAQALLTWLLGTTGEAFAQIHQRLRLTAAPLEALMDSHPSARGERRRMYVAWLMARLRQDRAEQVLSQWPTLAHTLCDRFLSLPPEMPTPFRLRDSQWATLAPILHLPGLKTSDPRIALHNLLSGTVRVAAAGEGQDKLIREWATTGQLRQALILLRRSHLDAPEHLAAQIEDEVHHLFQHEFIIDLCRQVYPALHRELVFELTH